MLAQTYVLGPVCDPMSSTLYFYLSISAEGFVNTKNFLPDIMKHHHICAKKTLFLYFSVLFVAADVFRRHWLCLSRLGFDFYHAA